MSFWESFWDIIWWFLFAFAFIAYLMALFAIVADLFRDRELNGWFKAIWFIFLIFIPFLTALVYLIARGRSMGERTVAAAQVAQDAQEQYIREVVGTDGDSRGSAAEIAEAKNLLDAGVISQQDFERLKEKALS